MEASSAEHVLEQSPFLVALGVNHLRHCWERVEPLLRQACAESRGEFTVEGILHNMGINDGVERWKLLVIVDGAHVKAAMVVCITQKADGERVLDCLLASGEDAREWPAVDPEFDAFAKACGCDKVRIPFARKGWLKALPHWRLVATGYVLEREV